MLRQPKALVIPFKFREGYPDNVVDPFIEQAAELIRDVGIEITLTKAVTYDSDADYVSSSYNPNAYDFTILLVPTWFEPVTLVRAIKNYISVPVVLWGFSNFVYNGQRVNLGSSAGAGCAKGTLREMGVKHEYIYYSPNTGRDEQIKETLRRVANVSRAIALLKNSRIVTVGYQFGGMTIGDMDLTRMRKDIGPDLIELDAYTLITRMNALDENGEEYQLAKNEVNELLAEDIGQRLLDKTTRMYAVLKQFVKEYNAQAITAKCHFALSQELGFAACIPLSVIGTRVVASCEADIPLTCTQLLLHYLSEGMATTYADTHELTGSRVLWGACGFAPATMCLNDQIVCQLPSDDSFGLGATFGDYITNRNYMKAGKVTIARLLKDPDCGYTMHATSGDAVGEIEPTSEFGAPQYAFTETTLDCDFDSFAQNLGSHHYALVYKNVLDDLELYCKYSGVRPLIER